MSPRLLVAATGILFAALAIVVPGDTLRAQQPAHARQDVKAHMAASNDTIADLVHKMNVATGAEKVAATAAVVKALVEHHEMCKSMCATMMK
jgi:hypothetical protein